MSVYVIIFQLVQRQSVDSGPLTSLAVCTTVCLVVVQENSNHRQLQTVLNACTERFERSPRDSCNLIGSTRFRVEPKQSGPKFLDPLFPRAVT